MTRVALDSNVLIYAEVEPDTAKGRRAAEVIVAAAQDGVIPTQALGEFVRFIQRRFPAGMKGALAQVALYRTAFITPPTTDELIAKAGELCSTHGMQLWDGVMIHAASAAGASVLLTEDMLDGRLVAGLRLLNPFDPINDDEIGRLFWLRANEDANG
ncbi:MAG: PIN domain-containing protein [Parvularculaceae bacterium]